MIAAIQAWAENRTYLVLLLLLGLMLAGCYAPIRSPGIPAAQLPEHFRYPIRTGGAPLNYSSLTVPPPQVYTLGNGDILEITVPDLIQVGEARPFQVQLLENGDIFLPRVGAVQVGGLTLADAQRKINERLAQGFLRQPGASVTLIEKGKINVVVLGAVEQPGVYALNRFENDVAHALAAAGGFAEDAGDMIEVHRRAGTVPQYQTAAPMPAGGYDVAPPRPPMNTHAPRNTFTPTEPISSSSSRYQPQPGLAAQPAVKQTTPAPPIRRATHTAPNPYGSYRSQPAPSRPASQTVIRGQSPYWPGDVFPGDNLPMEAYAEDSMPAVMYAQAAQDSIVRIPLRGNNTQINPCDIMLNPDDVVVVPRKVDQVFYVVGPLSETNRIRFTVGDRDREIGNGLLLPPDREVDVITAVAMAGYIDPIESPTTVTVHRIGPDGLPMLIRVNLIKARYNPEETVYIQPGDIVYLNPDAWWYSRRMFDRLIGNTVGRVFGD